MNRNECFFCGDVRTFLHTTETFGGWHICFPCHNFLYWNCASSSYCIRHSVIKTTEDKDVTCRKCGKFSNRMYYSLGYCNKCGHFLKEDYDPQLEEKSETHFYDNVGVRAQTIQLLNKINRGRSLPVDKKLFVERFFEGYEIK